MNKISTALMCACMALAAGSVAAQEAASGAQSNMSKDSMANHEMTMQDCKDHMAMMKKDGTNKDAATMKMQKDCTAMMKKHSGSTKNHPMKKEGTMNKDMPSDSMNK